MRESEAIELWCPFTRATWAKPTETGGWQADGSPVGFNRALIRPGNEERSVGRCIGAACMAWRNSGSVEADQQTEMVGLERTRTRTTSERVGYCGLAGSPGLSDAELIATPTTEDKGREDRA